MNKLDLGVKLNCQKCGARYYDLNKDAALCPKCGAANARPVVMRRNPKPAPVKRGLSWKHTNHSVSTDPPAPKTSQDATSSEPGEQDDTVMEDTTDLGGDDVQVTSPKDDG